MVEEVRTVYWAQLGLTWPRGHLGSDHVTRIPSLAAPRSQLAKDQGSEMMTSSWGLGIKEMLARFPRYGQDTEAGAGGWWGQTGRCSGQWCCHTVWWCQVSGQAGQHLHQVTRPVTVSFTVKYFTVPVTSYLPLRGG